MMQPYRAFHIHCPTQDGCRILKAMVHEPRMAFLPTQYREMALLLLYDPTLVFAAGDGGFLTARHRHRRRRSSLITNQSKMQQLRHGSDDAVGISL